MSFDPVTNPAHYTQDRTYEPAAVIQDWKLNFFLGNTVKYISRAGRKDPSATLQDLEKAVWYLAQEINALRGFAVGAARPTQAASTPPSEDIAKSVDETRCVSNDVFKAGFTTSDGRRVVDNVVYANVYSDGDFFIYESKLHAREECDPLNYPTVRVAVPCRLVEIVDGQA
ncbi:MAG: DUF3310 domain-containing protein [Gallionella sp.]|nr:DUF3310 domain-containing protein [Gallionella sp.]